MRSAIPMALLLGVVAPTVSLAQMPASPPLPPPAPREAPVTTQVPSPETTASTAPAGTPAAPPSASAATAPSAAGADTLAARARANRMTLPQMVAESPNASNLPDTLRRSDERIRNHVMRSICQGC